MSELYEMGLVSASCNGCENDRLRWELGDTYLALKRHGWTTVYEKGQPPTPGQGDPEEHMGQPIQFRRGFMSIGHSDECYHWKPPKNRVVEAKAEPY